MKNALALLPVLAVLALLGGCVITSNSDTCSNYCSDPWYLNYCVDGVMYGADCNDACTNDPGVYESTCGGTPAVAGECGADEGRCVCWCENAFDSCVDQDTIHYVRGGVEYTLSCKDYCEGGTCDAVNRACACP